MLGRYERDQVYTIEVVTWLPYTNLVSALLVLGSLFGLQEWKLSVLACRVPIQVSVNG